MWAKKIAAGVLAAALSLTLLTGCSGGGRSGSVISEGETISFDTSASYRLVQHTDRIYQPMSWNAPTKRMAQKSMPDRQTRCAVLREPTSRS